MHMVRALRHLNGGKERISPVFLAMLLAALSAVDLQIRDGSNFMISSSSRCLSLM
jgi:hypothetical protein